MIYLSQFNELIKQLGIVKLLQSKRFWSAIGGVITVIVANFDPSLEQYMPQIIEAASIGVVFLISGYSLQDVANAVVKAYMEFSKNE